MSQQPLRDLIHRGESQARGYDDYNGGTYIGHDGQPHIRGSSRAIDFSSMTLGEVQARQHRGEIFAVGLYQIIPDTMDSAVASLGLDPNQRFTPELQDRIFAEYLVTDKRPEVRDYVTGQPHATLHAAEVAMALEWASFGDPDRGGASHYGGANSASIGVDETARALEQMRADYRAGLARGLSPDAAFRAVAIGDAPLQTTHRGRVADEAGLLQPGDHGEQVRDLQHALAGQGYTGTGGRPLAIDGVFGPATEAAVEAFQRAQRLDVDGRVGPRTQAALGQAEQAHEVRTLQQALVTLGYPDAQGQPLAVDGVPGQATRAATEAFQRDHHLAVDGIAGAQTRAALEQALTARRPQATTAGPTEPDNPLYRQALAGVQKIDADMGRRSDQLSRNLATALAAEARTQGLTRIDAVAISEDGSRTFAVQNDAGIKRYADVPTAQAVHTPMAQSAAKLSATTAAPSLPTQTMARQRDIPAAETPHIA
ncbi:peptidoglycan-binding domain-containing protein [Dyella lutea]|uniref:Peptidoglycan-binding protein n=1 Tax=Dyella lutea TaxID=2950441 RepID=A0ABT1FAF3_9GAMM|nr:peptidoglycan-binding protein [Dyella lutea]MCP1373277.1 peptidoglycan-binding protein [Dyella lutea]